MKAMHYIHKKENSIDNTINIRKVINSVVLSKGGLLIGRISEVRIHPHKLKIQGVVINRGFFKKPIYVGENYFGRVTENSIILEIEPSVLLIGKRVINSDGKYAGRVMEVVRKESKNDIKFLKVKSTFSRTFDIKIEDVEHLGKSIVLRKGYNAPKKYFWQKSR